MTTIWAARSQNVFESLVMPGPLVTSHAKLEKDCNICHEPFSRQSQSRLCLSCHDHKGIVADRLLHRGYHGREPSAKQDCRNCHTDHKGRDADIVPFDRETFNHAFTNFDLKGAHKTIRCNDCHEQKAKLRNAPGRCFDCHKAQDPHKGHLGEKCEGCHTEDAWRKTRPFDHAQTKFPLVGAHKIVACTACHAGERYKGVVTACAECHRIQDVHSGRYGAKCETCHDQNKWKTTQFNHNKTRLPLRGGHVKVKCDTCHRGDLYQEKLETTCISCHRKDDLHQGKLGSRCEQCHGESTWRQELSFDHELTRFPLIGRHAVVPCEECHLSSLYKGAPRACAECHKDEHHAGRVGKNCALCHNPNGWGRWRYDHDTQTKYPLTGAHRSIHCHLCHTTKNAATIVLPTGCFDCHSSDDIHEGSFGRSCERCHNTTSFKRGGARQ